MSRLCPVLRYIYISILRHVSILGWETCMSCSPWGINKGILILILGFMLVMIFTLTS